MAMPWLPFNVGDYLADTTNLNTLQHGAYCLLLWAYWRKGFLPDDDDQLAAAAKCNMKTWLKMKPVIQAFFFDGWKHKRMEAELAKAKGISSKRSLAAKQKHINEHALADQLQTHIQQPKQKQINNNSLNGIVKAVKKPPFHGAQDKNNVYWEQEKPEFAPYADEYFQLHGKLPSVNKHGGRWFPKLGYQAEIAKRGIHPNYKPLEAAE